MTSGAGNYLELQTKLEEAEKYAYSLELEIGEAEQRIQRYQSERNHYRDKYIAIQKELEESEHSRDRFRELLQGVCDALKGVPSPEELIMHSWHDLPEVAQASVQAGRELYAEFARLRNTLDNCPCPTRNPFMSCSGPHGKCCQCEPDPPYPWKEEYGIL